MEPIAPDRLFLVEFIWESIKERVGWKRVMKRGIENCHVRYCGKETAHLLDPRKHHRIVQRGEGIKFFHLGQDFIRDHGELHQVRLAEAGGNGDVGRVPAHGDQDAADPRLVVARVEGVPRPA